MSLRAGNLDHNAEGEVVLAHADAQNHCGNHLYDVDPGRQLLS